MTIPKHAVQLDPDYRRMPDISQPWCERCQKPVNPKTAIRVTTLDFRVWRDDKGKGWLGKDCAKIINLPNTHIEGGAS